MDFDLGYKIFRQNLGVVILEPGLHAKGHLFYNTEKKRYEIKIRAEDSVEERIKTFIHECLHITSICTEKRIIEHEELEAKIERETQKVYVEEPELIFALDTAMRYARVGEYFNI